MERRVPSAAGCQVGDVDGLVMMPGSQVGDRRPGAAPFPPDRRLGRQQQGHVTAPAPSQKKNLKDFAVDHQSRPAKAVMSATSAATSSSVVSHEHMKRAPPEPMKV